jgi:flagellar hook-associated protein 1 FlgK
MTSTFFGIEIARRGLQAHRRSMDTTGHNIANANTPGYSRQEAVHTASHPHSVPSLNRQMNPGQLGSGVSVDFIRRIRNEYLDNQYRDNAATEGFWQAKLDVAQQTELIFPEPSGRGVQSVMLNFFNDWHELNNNPQDAGVKAAVRESGLELASIFR